MKQYLDLVRDVLENGVERGDRTGVGTVSIFGRQVRFDLQEGFPLVTTKLTRTKSIIRELLWILSGSTDIKDLHPCKIWDAWADEDGELGPVYGAQWRSWPVFKPGLPDWNERWEYRDQISEVVASIKNNPWSRRHIVNAWNVGYIEDMALPPCHCFFQFYVRPSEDGQPRYLDCQLYQRSADIALGVPFNIASYAILTHLIALECDLEPGEFVHTFGDLHAYLNHVDGLTEQLKRDPHPLPKLVINKKPLFEYELSDFKIVDYVHDPAIKFPIAV